jgi:hypothetical protein
VGIFRRAFVGWEEYGRCLCHLGRFLDAIESGKDNPLEKKQVGIRILYGRSNGEYLEQDGRPFLLVLYGHDVKSCRQLWP